MRRPRGYFLAAALLWSWALLVPACRVRLDMEPDASLSTVRGIMTLVLPYGTAETGVAFPFDMEQGPLKIEKKGFLGALFAVNDTMEDCPTTASEFYEQLPNFRLTSTPDKHYQAVSYYPYNIPGAPFDQKFNVTQVELIFNMTDVKLGEDALLYNNTAGANDTDFGDPFNLLVYAGVSNGWLWSKNFVAESYLDLKGLLNTSFRANAYVNKSADSQTRLHVLIPKFTLNLIYRDSLYIDGNASCELDNSCWGVQTQLTITANLSLKGELGCSKDCGNFGRCVTDDVGNFSCECQCGWGLSAQGKCDKPLGFCPMFSNQSVFLAAEGCPAGSDNSAAPAGSPEVQAPGTGGPRGCPDGFGWDLSSLSCLRCPPGFYGVACSSCSSNAACQGLLDDPGAVCLHDPMYRSQTVGKNYTCDVLSDDISSLLGETVWFSCNTLTDDTAISQDLRNAISGVTQLPGGAGVVQRPHCNLGIMLPSGSVAECLLTQCQFVANSSDVVCKEFDCSCKDGCILDGQDVTETFEGFSGRVELRCDPGTDSGAGVKCKVQIDVLAEVEVDLSCFATECNQPSLASFLRGSIQEHVDNSDIVNPIIAALPIMVLLACATVCSAAVVLAWDYIRPPKRSALASPPESLSSDTLGASRCVEMGEKSDEARAEAPQSLANVAITTSPQPVPDPREHEGSSPTASPNASLAPQLVAESREEGGDPPAASAAARQAPQLVAESRDDGGGPAGASSALLCCHQHEVESAGVESGSAGISATPEPLAESIVYSDVDWTMVTPKAGAKREGSIQSLSFNKIAVWRRDLPILSSMPQLCSRRGAAAPMTSDGLPCSREPNDCESGRLAGSGKQLIHSMSSSAERGLLVGILGPSGSGKSTLLNVLSGTIQHGGKWKISGSLSLDGVPLRPGDMALLSAHVPQHELIMRSLTVEECLRYSAAIRLDPSLPSSVVRERVEAVMADLSIAHIRGSVCSKGTSSEVSGGERTRVSIGMELVTDPQVIMLDEPTSGLDSHSAMQLVKSLQRIARRGPGGEGQRIVIASIHQPSPTLFNTLDKVMLLATGHMLYAGPPAGVKGAFEAFGLPMSESSGSIAEHMLQCVGSQELVAKMLHQIESFTLKGSGSPPVEYCDSQSSVSRQEYRSRVALWKRKRAPMRELGIIMWRTGIDVLRNPALAMAHAIVGASTGLVLGFLYYQSDLDIAGAQNRAGATFASTVIMATQCTSVASIIQPERVLVTREISRGYYSPVTYMISKILLDGLILRVIPAILYAVPLYWLMGLRDSASAFCIFMFVLASFSAVVGNLCMCVANLTSTMGTAVMVCNGLLFFGILLAGFLVNLDGVTWALKWASYISPFRYAWGALVINELEPVTITFDPPGLPSAQVGGSLMLTILGVNPDDLQIYIIVISILFVGLSLCSILTFMLRHQLIVKGWTDA